MNQPECPFHRSPPQSNCWQGHSGQPGTTSSPPNGCPRRVCLQALARVDLEEWPEAGQEQARELVLKWEHVFAHCDLDLGKTPLNKHQIKLMDQMPFKEHYWHIPPHIYDNVKANLQEMLDIGAIRMLHSPWASAVVLVQQKDWSLRFCIDLRKLNNKTIKDPYLLPCIDETLDSLQGSQWFSLLKLKSGYWQVEMDEESKPLTAFTVGLLGFYVCDRMPFGLNQCPCNLPVVDADLPQGPQLQLVYHLFG